MFILTVRCSGEARNGQNLAKLRVVRTGYRPDVSEAGGGGEARRPVWPPRPVGLRRVGLRRVAQWAHRRRAAGTASCGKAVGPRCGTRNCRTTVPCGRAVGPSRGTRRFTTTSPCVPEGSAGAVIESAIVHRPCRGVPRSSTGDHDAFRRDRPRNRRPNRRSGGSRRSAREDPGNSPLIPRTTRPSLRPITPGRRSRIAPTRRSRPSLPRVAPAHRSHASLPPIAPTRRSRPSLPRVAPAHRSGPSLWPMARACSRGSSQALRSRFVASSAAELAGCAMADAPAALAHGVVRGRVGRGDSRDARVAPKLRRRGTRRRHPWTIAGFRRKGGRR